ncbi:MAG: hypothetical protein ACTS44_00020 [Candidatus Hodgkinia cicadicola]
MSKINFDRKLVNFKIEPLFNQFESNLTMRQALEGNVKLWLLFNLELILNIYTSSLRR